MHDTSPTAPPAPFAGRTTRNFKQDHSDPHTCVPDAAGYCPCPEELAPADTAELVCSDVAGEDHHLPVIDLDFQAQLVPSGTPGHFHLYLDQPVEWDAYVRVLTAMALAGLVQWGFRDTTVRRGFGSVRHPDRPKQAGQ